MSFPLAIDGRNFSFSQRGKHIQRLNKVEGNQLCALPIDFLINFFDIILPSHQIRADWAQQDFAQPQIISKAIKPLTEIISNRHLAAYGINADKINKWFVPLMRNFCVEMNKMLPKSQQITCTHKTGCGIDDDCTVDEVCRTVLSGGYVCGRENESVCSEPLD